MATAFNFGCPREVRRGSGKRVRCDQPLTLKNTDEMFGHFLCPAGHEQRYTLRYLSRFQIPARGGRGSVPILGRCLHCGTPLDLTTDQIADGYGVCGSCGAYHKYSFSHHEWEVDHAK